MQYLKCYFKRPVALAVVLLSLGGCQPPGLKSDGSPQFVPAEQNLIFSMSPLAEAPANPSNRFATNEAAAQLGKVLFYEPKLSGNGQISCATCHQPTRGWSDGLPVANTLGPGTRNTPTLWNVAHQRWYFGDGRADSLWSQAIQPIESPIEMGRSRVSLYHLFQQDSQLKQDYQKVFGAMPVMQAALPKEARPVPKSPQDPQHQAWQSISPQDQLAVNRFVANLGKALEAFERQMISPESDFDRFAKGLRTQDVQAQSALSAEAQKGLRLFLGRGQCILCHSGPNLSDGEFHNIGLPAIAKNQDSGRYQGIQDLQKDPLNSLGAFSDLPADDPWADKLRYVEAQESNKGEFKTPTLRELTQTAPYMHDGRFKTLEEVIAFYNDPTVHKAAIGRREDTLQPLKLTPEEASQLLAFLKSLSTGKTPASLMP